MRVITLTHRSVFVPFVAGETTLLALRRDVEVGTGVACEWQKIFRGGAELTGEPGALLAGLGVRAGSNLFLTHRIEGIEYSRA